MKEVCAKKTTNDNLNQADLWHANQEIRLFVDSILNLLWIMHAHVMSGSPAERKAYFHRSHYCSHISKRLSCS